MIEDSTIPSGAVLACYGNGCFSWAIRLWTGFLSLVTFRPQRAPSHVAITCRADGTLYVFESTTLSGVPDALDGEKRDGVQAHRLKDFLAHYDGTVRLYRPKKLLRRWQLDNLQKYLMDRHRAKAPYDMSGAFGSASPREVTKDDSALFCSELVTFAMMAAGMMAVDRNPSEQTPGDVIRYRCLYPAEQLK